MKQWSGAWRALRDAWNSWRECRTRCCVQAARVFQAEYVWRERRWLSASERFLTGLSWFGVAVAPIVLYVPGAWKWASDGGARLGMGLLFPLVLYVGAIGGICYLFTDGGRTYVRGSLGLRLKDYSNELENVIGRVLSCVVGGVLAGAGISLVLSTDLLGLLAALGGIAGVCFLFSKAGRAYVLGSLGLHFGDLWREVEQVIWRILGCILLGIAAGAAAGVVTSMALSLACGLLASSVVILGGVLVGAAAGILVSVAFVFVISAALFAWSLLLKPRRRRAQLRP